jgi:outer membrane autotransporter protein
MDHAGSEPTVDLTIVTGDLLPASVNDSGISASAAGVGSIASLTAYSSVENSDPITVTGIGGVTGLDTFGEYSATLDNSGAISANAIGPGDAIAYGASSVSDHLSYLTNELSGSIDAGAYSQDGDTFAVGALAAGWDAATLHNDGAISATASSATGDAQAYAAAASGGYSGIGVVINGGDLQAAASAGDGGTAMAIGAYAYANVASVFNDGSSSAVAIAGDGGSASARGARANGIYAATSNYGELTASATADGGSALAHGADALGYLGASVYNAGDVQAIATADGGNASAVGTYSLAYIFGAYATNVGSISAEAIGDSATATGVVNASLYVGNAITTNSGDIDAVASGGVGPYGEVDAVATGVYNFAMIYDSVVDNSGSVSATATATADLDSGYLVAKALGVEAVNGYGYGVAGVTNSGDISASVTTANRGYALAWGVVAQSSGSYGGDTWIENDGSITSSAHTGVGLAFAYGAYAISQLDDVTVVNHGDVVAVARADSAKVAYGYATAVRASGLYGNASVSNDANIEAHASVYGGIAGARGIQVYGESISIANAAGATITATGEAELLGGGYATGIEANGIYGIDVTNDGDIVAYGHAHGHVYGGYANFGFSSALGIYATAGFLGDVSVVNTGDITATAISEDSITFFNGGAGATGISTYAKYDASVVNAGDIHVTATSGLGVSVAYGAYAHGKYTSNIVNAAGASIVASATVGSLYSDEYGGRAFSQGIKIGGTDDGIVDNDGIVVSHATVTPDGGANSRRSEATAFGVSVGAFSDVQAGAMVNAGHIEAIASADFGYASAYATFVHAGFDATTSNAGDILAVASAANGNAFAVGSYAFAEHAKVTYDCSYTVPYGNICDYAHPIVTVDGGESLADNSGNIVAMADAEGGVGYSYGVAVLGGFSAGITNTGHISAVTAADDALAIGGLANSFYGDALLQNSGVITAAATGDTANAIGASVLGAYGSAGNGYLAVIVDNQGTIAARADGTTATATGVEAIGRHDDGVLVSNTGAIVAGAYGADATAIAVSMDSSGRNVLTNAGTIAALGDGTRIAISSGSSATASLANSGSIIGAIRTGDLDDSLVNASGALWHAVGTSDFGAGDDHVVNHGTIVMDDAVIRLGRYVGGNTFDNFGVIAVSGAGNVLDMDNPFAVTNDGVISFVDGAPDDVLTINGDFTGQGAINVDVSGLHQSSDRLYVDGNVIGPTTQTLNVNLVDLPTSASVDIPIVNVRGDSLASDFVLGDVHYGADGFLSMAFSLKSTVDASNAADDVVSLGVAVTGLNDQGALAADIAPGVQSLVNAQVGTWRQRMGVVPAKGTIGLAPWVRMFADSGDVDPTHSANFGAGGDFGFQQSNHGWELGLDTRPFEHVAFGVLLGKSDGSQHLSTGAGTDRFDGRTFGLYATWLGDNGFYLDASLRWTGIDARLRSAGGNHTTSAEADAFNVEAGLTAWTLGNGINVVPQLQYTNTRVGDISAVRGDQSTFVGDGGTSSRGRVGVAFDKTFQGAGLTWTPYGSLNAVHEFDGEFGYAVNGGLLGSTRTDGTSAMVELGLGARRDKLTVTGGVNWTDGGALQGVFGGQMVVRYSW